MNLRFCKADAVFDADACAPNGLATGHGSRRIGRSERERARGPWMGGGGGLVRARGVTWSMYLTAQNFTQKDFYDY